MSTTVDYLRGNLDAAGRIWTSAGPALFIIGYMVLGLVLYLVRNRLRGPYIDAEIQTRGSSVLLGMGLRQYFSFIMQPLMRSLLYLKLPATALTTLSVLLASGAAVSVGAGRFALGGWLYVFGGLCDFFDGRLARASGSAGPRGAALDSILDRFSDGVMLVGLSWYYRNSWLLPVLGMLLIGSFLVSYVRAKGESLQVVMKDVGLMQRPERIVYLGLSVALSPILDARYFPDEKHPPHVLAMLVISIMAVSTLLTAARRLSFLLRALGDPPLGEWQGVDRQGLRRFCISSAMATTIDFGLVVWLVENQVQSPWLATLGACVAGGLVNYLLSRAWNRGSRRPQAVLGSRYSFVSASSALLNSGGVAVLLALPALDYRLAWWIARLAVFLFWNFPLNRDYVFAGPAGAGTPSPSEEGD